MERKEEVMRIENEIIDLDATKEKACFIERVEDEEVRGLYRTILEKRVGKNRAKDLAKTVKDLIESDYVTFSDGTGLTINDMLTVKVVKNMLEKEDLAAKDLIDLKKVASDEDKEVNLGLQINIITNGQNLGE